MSRAPDSSAVILTSVIMSMQGNNDLFSLRNVLVKVFDLVVAGVSASYLEKSCVHT